MCSRLFTVCALSAVVMSMVAALGCQGNSASSGTTGSRSRSAMNTSGDAAVLAHVERSHVIGPAAAREMDYRVAWQYLGNDRNVKVFTVQGDSVFVLDGQNFLTRIKVADGNRLWRMQVAEPIEEIMGVTYDHHDRVYVTTGGAILALDANTGSQVQRQRLLQIASTEPVGYGQNLIYGSRNGQIVWHSVAVGQHRQGYQIARAVHVPPMLRDNYLAAVGNDGTVIVLNPQTARQYWSKRLLAPVVCQPAIGDYALYVAGLDHYLWAYELGTGRNLWRVLTESELVDSPTLIGERLYQHVPRHGLRCYNALPWDHPGGELIWSSPSVRGNVLFQRRSDLFVWDKENRRMTLVDAERGSIVRMIDLPAASRLLNAGDAGTDIYALGEDGRVVRIVPRN